MFLTLSVFLQDLGIVGSSFVQVKLNFGHLKKLKNIELLRNNITELGDDWFSKGLPYLERLYIEGSNITRIGSNVFSRLNNLRIIRFDEQPIGHH